MANLISVSAPLIGCAAVIVWTRMAIVGMYRYVCSDGLVPAMYALLGAKATLNKRIHVFYLPISRSIRNKIGCHPLNIVTVVASTTNSSRTAVARSGRNLSSRSSFKVCSPFSLSPIPALPPLPSGLREYLESPYSTYQQPCDRSKWRNQFLVDYLSNQGIDRSKKQVASHIQVLRKMWIGEPRPSLPLSLPSTIHLPFVEFHLVAGGNDLYSPVAVNLEGAHSMIPYDPIVSVQPKYPTNPTLSTLTQLNPPSAVTRHSGVTSTHSQNKVTSILLLANGMTPLTVKFDAPSQQLEVPMLKIRLCLPTVTDKRAPDTLHGFHATLSLENVWRSTSQCVTEVFANKALLTRQAGFLNITDINVGNVNAALPESSLNKCRWLDACEPCSKRRKKN